MLKFFNYVLKFIFNANSVKRMPKYENKNKNKNGGKLTNE